MTKKKPPEEIAPENAGENTPDGKKKKYGVVLKGRDDNGIMYEQALETPFEVEVLTPESLAYLQDQAEYIPGGFAGAWRIMERRTHEQKPTKSKEEQATYFEDIAPYFECGMLAYMVMSANRHKELDFIMENFGNSGDRIFALYGKRAAFIKKELQKEFYEGRTIEELEDEYINMFLALPFEEQQKALDKKEIYLFPGTKYEHFIKAWQAFLLKDGGEIAFKLREPSGVILPFDKVTSAMFNQKNKEQAETITGSIRVESKKERAKGKELETKYIIEREDKQIALSMSKKDLFFLMMIDGIYVQAVYDGVPGNKVEATPLDLAKIIYRAQRPGTAYVEEIKEAVTRMRNISVRINNEQEAKERGKDTLPDTFYLLPCEFRNGKVHILKRPVLIDEWVIPIMGEFTTISPDILGVPKVNKTDDNCAIILELLRSALGSFTHKNAITGEKEIPFSLLFENCGILGNSQADRNKKARLKKNCIIPSLVYWSAGNFSGGERETKYKDAPKMPVPTRIIDGFRIDRDTIYIIPRAKGIDGKKKPNAKK